VAFLLKAFAQFVAEHHDSSALELISAGLLPFLLPSIKASPFCKLSATITAFHQGFPLMPFSDYEL
jgi:hypothetical protein